MLKKLHFAFLWALMTASTDSFSQTIALDGEWQFAVDRNRTFQIGNVKDTAAWRIARVPLSWQAQFDDLRDYQGVAWYRKSFTLPRLKSSETVLLQFGAVDYRAEVFVNGKPVGTHEGGYTPFEFDIRKYVESRQNEVIVRVMDPEANESGTEGISYWHIPHGKQSWYVQTSGLWQSVNVKILPLHRITGVRATTSIEGKVSFEVSVQPAERRRGQELLSLRVLDPQRREVLRIAQSISPGRDLALLEGVVEKPQLWSPDTPNFYEAEVRLGDEHKVVERFGFRSFEARDGRLYLNGEPFYLIAALDQDFYPETIYTTPSEDYLRAEMLKAKQIGLNMLRCHIKVPDPRYLKVADEVGLLVWYEIPNWDVFTPEAGRRANATLDAMLDRDWNHPSLVIISLINEGWGLDLKQAEQRQWLLSAFERAKQKATGRLIVDNSACWGNFHVKTDINDYHTYWAIPENRRRFDATVNEFAKRPKWLFSESGDSQETGKEPLLMSEFGNWGLPKLPENLPWWFERDFGGREVTLPKGVHQRVTDFRYGEVFGSYNQLAEESQRAQFMALKYEIEQLRMQQEIQGYVITEFTDINWECNGLLDMWRNLKIYADDLARLQQQDVIIPRPVKYNYWDDEVVEIKVWLSRYSAVDFEGCSLRWSADTLASGELPAPKIARAEVKELTPVAFPLNKVAAPQRIRLKLTLRDHRHKTLAENDAEVFVYPKSYRNSTGSIAVFDPTKSFGAFSHALRDAGYNVTPSTKNNGLVITNILDAGILDVLKSGGTVLCLVDSNTAIPAGMPLKLTSRDAEWYDGNWASNLNWLRHDRRPFSKLNFGKFWGFESIEVAPKTVITGLPPQAFSDVLAGMFVGWVHLNSAYVLQMKVEAGKLILCTLPLAGSYSRDPYATLLLNELVQYSTSVDCAPQWGQ